MKLLKTNKNITLNTIEKNLIFDLVNIEIKKCIPFIEDDYKNKLIKIKNKIKRYTPKILKVGYRLVFMLL